MSGEAGTQMPEHEIDFYHCGTNVAGWLNGIHPEAAGKVIHPEYYKNYAYVLERFFSKSEKLSWVFIVHTVVCQKAHKIGQYGVKWP